MEILVRLVASLSIDYKDLLVLRALCAMDGQVGQATSSKDQVVGECAIQVNTRTLLFTLYQQSPEKPRAGSALPDALLAQRRQERRKTESVTASRQNCMGDVLNEKKLKLPWSVGKE
jgi:hypothetical protein